MSTINKRQSAFTIIEVLIVITLAGAIFFLILTSKNYLDKNRRNAQYRDLISRINTEIQNYQENNDGSLPTANDHSRTGISGGFAMRYLGCDKVMNFWDDSIRCSVDINHPQKGVPVFIDSDPGAPTYIDPSAFPTSPYTGWGHVHYITNNACDGESLKSAPGHYALAVALEGGSIYCVDSI